MVNKVVDTENTQNIDRLCSNPALNPRYIIPTTTNSMPNPQKALTDNFRAFAIFPGPPIVYTR
jgi:hypothetical protein